MSALIVDNRKAKYHYHLEKTIEAGICLEGWEIKSLRAGKGQITESHVIIKNGEALLIGSNFAPLPTASTHIKPVADRTRKLLLKKKEINTLIGASEQQGFTIAVLNLHWKKNLVKVDIALAKGKKLYDKRQTQKERDWRLEKQRLVKARIKLKNPPT